MNRWLVVAFGVVSYLVFFGTFLYAIGLKSSPHSRHLWRRLPEFAAMHRSSARR